MKKKLNDELLLLDVEGAVYGNIMAPTRNTTHTHTNPSHAQKSQLYLPKHACSMNSCNYRNHDEFSTPYLRRLIPAAHVPSLWKQNTGRKRKQNRLRDCTVSRLRGEKLIRTTNICERAEPTRDDRTLMAYESFT